MGNSAQTIAQGFQNDDRLGIIKIIEAQDAITDQQNGQIMRVIQLTKIVHSQKQVEEWLKNMVKINDSQSRELLFLPLRHRFQKTCFCSTNGIVHATYEYYPFTLENEIKNRIKLNQHFTQAEIWFILYNLVRVGNKFQKIKMKIGDVQTNNILLSEDGRMKLISIVSFPNQLSNFYKIVQDRSVTVLLAPEEIDQLAFKTGVYPDNVDPCLAEVFSIGLTILYAATLRDSSKIYSKQHNFQIILKKLKEIIIELSLRYGTYLVKTITSMLQINPNQRKKCSDIYKILHQKEKYILNLMAFAIEEPITQQKYIVKQQIKNPYGPVQYLNQSDDSPISSEQSMLRAPIQTFILNRSENY